MAAKTDPAPTRIAPYWLPRLVAVCAALLWLRFFVATTQAIRALPRFQEQTASANSHQDRRLLFPFLATAEPSITPIPTLTATAAPSLTPTPTATPTASITPLPPTPTLADGSARQNPIDGQIMLYIPAGSFRMGDGREGRTPHKVTLDDFWMGRTQVTNAQYRRCVEAGGCTKPIRKEINPHYYDPAFDDHPAVYVVWGQALAYCAWAGGSLPTEAQWERAAAGDGKRTYPWGKGSPGGKRSNINHPEGTTKPVASYPLGASPYGVMDMGGNVREWVWDWYSRSYFKRSPELNPTGPEKGEKHVLRGAAWHDPVEYGIVFSRYAHVPDSAGANRGFRCAFPADE